jgi:hypothetical protein
MTILIIIAAIFVVIMVVFGSSSKPERRRRQGRVRRVQPEQTSDVYFAPTDNSLLHNTSHIHSDTFGHGDSHVGVYATDSNAAGVDSVGSWDFGGSVDAGGGSDFSGGGDS